MTTKAESNRRSEISNDLGNHAVQRIEQILQDQRDLCSTPYMQLRVMMIVASSILQTIDDYFSGPLSEVAGNDWNVEPERRYTVMASAIMALTGSEPPTSHRGKIAAAAYLSAFCVKHPEDPDMRGIARMVGDLLGEEAMFDALLTKVKERAKR